MTLKQKLFAGAAGLALLTGATTFSYAQLAPSPEWRQVLPTGPIAGAKYSDEFVKGAGKLAYVWAYPMVQVQARFDAMSQVKEPGLVNGVVPAAPVNQLAMLTDYIDAAQRYVTAPSQDLFAGQAALDLSKEPVVVQVPDFGDRFFVFQAVDQRTDTFAEIGSPYGTRIGFYLLVGPDWRGEVPKSIARVFRSPTNVAFLFPRIFVDDTPEDKKAVMDKLQWVTAYPMSQYDRMPKKRDWTTLAKTTAAGGGGSGELQWVKPENFPEDLARVVASVPPMAGEETLHALFKSLADAAANNPKVKEILKQAAIEADKELVSPMFDYRNFGTALPDNWMTVTNGAEFGADYYTRAGAAKASIFMNKPNVARYFTTAQDEKGQQLNGKNRYTLTFLKGRTPPVTGFWSLTAYNKNRFFEPNSIKRYSVGTKNKDLKTNADGTTTIYLQADQPTDPVQRANWLPTPKNDDFSLNIRAYGPRVPIVDGAWTPPPVKALGEARAVGNGK
jgi:hypothetical protein